jgi:PAS domain S-box-containing protein
MIRFFIRQWKHFKETVIHYGWLSLIIIPILALVNWSYFTVVNSERDTLVSQQLSLATEKINIIDFIVSSAISNTSNDLHVIADADEMSSYLNDSSPINLDAAEQLFYRIANNKPQFESVEFIDNSGQQIISLQRQNGNLVITEQANLMDKSSEDFFLTASTLSEDQLYILPLYFKSEDVNGTIIEKPMTGLVTTIYDQAETKRGYLFISYNADYLVSLFDEYVKNDSQFIEMGMLNRNQFYDITSDFTEYYENIQSLDDDNVVYVNVDLGKTITDEIANEEGFFKIVAITNFDDVFDFYGGFALRYPGGIIFLNILAIGVVYAFAWFLKSKRDDQILINANMYLSDKNNDGVMITDEKGDITYTNSAFEEIFGFRIEELKGKRPNIVFGDADFSVEKRIFKAKEAFAENVWNVNKHGIYILKHLRAKPESGSGDKIKHFLAIYSNPQIDIESLTFSNSFQSIETYKLLAKPFDSSVLKIGSTCYMVIRTYNEKSRKVYGQNNNENLSLMAFPNFLKNALNDEFKIAVPADGTTLIHVDLDDIEQELEEILTDIETIIERYKHQPNINSNLEYSFGISIANNKTFTKAEVIENAFIALQMAKNQKNIKHLVYTEHIRKVIKRQKDIYDQLENGFNYDEFYLQYQIQKNMKTNKYDGVEALLRWHNGTLGNISPVEFINVIENSFFINRLSIMIVEKVIKDFTPYIEYLRPDFKISINLTSFDFLNEDIIYQLVNLIEKSEIPTHNFTFEITESGYLENQEKTNTIIDFLHTKQILVSIDDFGTGFSTFEILKTLHVDKVKIDRSFIKDYPETDNGDIFKTISNLVKTLKFGLLVEGTETKEQVDFAVKCGCEEVQGFYISKPLYIENLAKRYLKTKADF